MPVRVTRYVVDLDAGPRLIVLQQNGTRVATRTAVPGRPRLGRAPRHRSSRLGVGSRWRPGLPSLPRAPLHPAPAMTPRSSTMRRPPSSASAALARWPPWPSLPVATPARRRGSVDGATGGFKVPNLTALDKLGTPEGEVNVLAWPGYVEDGSNDPKVDWVPRSRRSPAARSRQDVRHLGRGRAAHAHRPVRHGLGLRRRHPSAHRGRRRRAGQHRPHLELPGHLRQSEDAAMELGPRRALRHPPRPWREPAHVAHRPGQAGSRQLVRPCSTRRAAKRARSRHTTRPSTSPTRGCTSWPPSPSSESRTPTPSTRSSWRGRRPAQGAEGQHRRVLVGLPQGDPGLQDRLVDASAPHGR